MKKYISRTMNPKWVMCLFVLCIFLFNPETSYAQADVLWALDTANSSDTAWNPSAGGGMLGSTVENTGGLLPVNSSQNQNIGGTNAIKIAYIGVGGGAWWAAVQSDGIGGPGTNASDVRNHVYLNFYIKGETGGEVLNIKLEDTAPGQTNELNITNYVYVNKGWQPVSIPLAAFNWGGGDSQYLNKVTFAQKSVSTDTVWIDNIYFSDTDAVSKPGIPQFLTPVVNGTSFETSASSINMSGTVAEDGDNIYLYVNNTLTDSDIDGDSVWVFNGVNITWGSTYALEVAARRGDTWSDTGSISIQASPETDLLWLLDTPNAGDTMWSTSSGDSSVPSSLVTANGAPNTPLPMVSSENQNTGGTNALRLAYTHAAGGNWWAVIQSNGQGEPGTGFFNIKKYQYINYYIKGDTGGEGISMKIEDQGGGQTLQLDLGGYATVNRYWQPVSVPLSAFSWNTADSQYISKVVFFAWAVGTDTVWIDNINLSNTPAVTIPDTPFITAPGVNGATFKTVASSISISGTVTGEGNNIYFYLNGSLTDTDFGGDTVWTFNNVSLVPGVSNLVEVVSGRSNVWSDTAILNVISTGPVVIFTDPDPGAVNVLKSASITVVFDTMMDTILVQQGFFYTNGTDAFGSDSGAWSWTGTETGVFTPGNDLDTSTLYTVFLYADTIKTLLGDSLYQDYIFSFTTESATVPSSIGSGIIYAIPGGSVNIPNDTLTCLTAPPNAFAEDVMVTIVKDTSEHGRIKYEIIARRLSDNGIIHFLQKDISIVFHNPDENGDGLIDYLEPIPVNAGEKELAVYFHNDVEWIFLGGTVNTGNHTISIDLKHLTLFAVAGNNSPDQFGFNTSILNPEPNPFTPNNDGVNDIARFHFYNPGNIEFTLSIYTIRGQLIDKFTGNGVMEIEWDGRDKYGNPLQAGLYIFHVAGPGFHYGGTVVLAR